MLNVLSTLTPGEAVTEDGEGRKSRNLRRVSRHAHMNMHAVSLPDRATCHASRTAVGTNHSRNTHIHTPSYNSVMMRCLTKCLMISTFSVSTLSKTLLKQNHSFCSIKPDFHDAKTIILFQTAICTPEHFLN